MFINILLVLVGGGIGSVCRYLFTFYATRWLGKGFPWGTLGVNLTGCLLIGLVFSLAGRNIVNPQTRLLVMTGFLGGLTTFSTYALESTNYLIGNETLIAITNLVVNNFGGLLFVLLGFWLGELIS